MAASCQPPDAEPCSQPACNVILYLLREVFLELCLWLSVALVEKPWLSYCHHFEDSFKIILHPGSAGSLTAGR